MELDRVGAAITPLCRQPGRVVITHLRIYFQPFNVVSSAPTQAYPLRKVQMCSADEPLIGLVAAMWEALALYLHPENSRCKSTCDMTMPRQL